MKAYGLRNKFRYNYVDSHPKKGYVNWWEDELGSLSSKKLDRERGKKDIKEQLHEEQFNTYEPAN